MKNSLPKGWVHAKLGEVADYLNGRAFKPSEWKSEGLPIIRIQNLNDPSAAYNYSEQEHGERFSVRNGDLLFAWSASLGAYIWDGDDAWLNQHIFKVEPKEQIDKLYLFHALTNVVDSLYAKAHGSGMVHVTKKKFEETLIPLPPLAEQRRIVAQLDAVMQKLEASQERLDKLPDLLKRFRQAVLAAAVSGKLTEAWRAEQPQGETGTDLLDRIRAERRAQWEKKQQAKLSGKQLSLNDSWKSKYEEPAAPDTSELPELPEGWVWTTMPMVGELNRGKSKHRPRNDEALYGGPYPFIQTGDVSRANRIIDSYKQTYSELGLEQSKLWAKGTLCITIAANIADTAILGFDACFPDSIVGFLANPDRIEIDFVEFFLSTAKANIEHYAPATAQKNINLDILSQVAMPLPSHIEQQEIVRQVNHYFELADQLEARFEQAAALVEQLPQALLAKAFSGQLVPQDPNDEPASALLDLLQAEPATPAKGKRGRKAKVATEAPLFE